MAIRPQCARIVMSHHKESSYGTTLLDANINKLYEPEEPIIPELGVTYEDDADLIKGHEFPKFAELLIQTEQNVTIPLNFPASCTVLGILSVMALGNLATSGGGSDFSHVIKMLDPCTTDQLPSASWVLLLVGDADATYRVKGVVINELRIAMNGVKELLVTGSAISDGHLDPSTVTIPGSTAHADFLTGGMCDFLIGDEGGSLTSKKSVLRSFEFTINNNLDTADGRSNPAIATKYLQSLRFGNRAVSMVVTVEGHRTSTAGSFFQDFVNQTFKDVQITVTKSATRSLDIRLKRCVCTGFVESFDGIRDVVQLTYRAFYVEADASPVIVTIENGISAYLVNGS